MPGLPVSRRYVGGAKAAAGSKKRPVPEPVPAAPVPAFDPLASRARAFCVAIQRRGTPLKLQGKSPLEFLPHLKKTRFAWINFTVDDLRRDTPAVLSALGFREHIEQFLDVEGDHFSKYEDHDTELWLMVPAIEVVKMQVHSYPLIILLRRGLILTIHPPEIERLRRLARYADIFIQKIPPEAAWNDKLTVVLHRILDENNEKNFEGIRSIEDESDEISQMLTDPKTPMVRLAPEIYKMKHTLITYLNGLWASMDVIHFLRYGDAEIITDDENIINRFIVLSQDITWHIQLGENLSEVLASGLEVLQGIYNNQLQVLNNRLAIVVAWLTIVGTAVLVPNTLATIFGIPAVSDSINSTFGDLTLQFIFWVMLFSTAFSSFIAYWLLKRKGWIPSVVE